MICVMKNNGILASSAETEESHIYFYTSVEPHSCIVWLVTLHITDHTRHITRWGPHRKSTESKGWPCSLRESCYEIKPRPTPADFNNSAYSQSPTFIFSSVRVEGWWGMLEAKHSANSWLFPGPRYHWPGFLLGQNRAWTIEFWAAGCSLFAYLACHADEATSLDMSLHHPAALECTLHHN